MATRSVTTIFNADDYPIISIYRQYDGYPEGHGVELFSWGTGRYVVNGYNGNDKEARAWNGMGCCAADLVCALKREDGSPGGVYLMRNADELDGIEYWYELRLRGRKLLLLVRDKDGTLFDGLLDGFVSYFEEEKDEEDETEEETTVDLERFEMLD